MKKSSLYLFLILLVFSFHPIGFSTEFSLEKQVQKVIQETLPSVFQISVKGGSSGEKFGSGFLIDKNKGWLLTNYHVIAQAKQIQVRTKEQEKWLDANVLYHDSRRDLGLLGLTNKHNLPKNIPFPSKKTKPQMGQFVIALGSPGGYEYSATLGIVSSVGRNLNDLNVDFGFIQFDAATYYGSSGGPVVDLNGHLVAVSSRGGAQGAAGFGIPVSIIDSFLKEYQTAKKNKKAENPFGYLYALLQPLDDDLREFFGYELDGGALVRYSAIPNLKIGDVLMKVGDLKIRAQSMNEIEKTLNEISGLGIGSHKGQIFRNQKKMEISIPLKRSPFCEMDPLELKKMSARVINVKDRCTFFPKGNFLEISRYWTSERKNNSLKEGDLVVKIDGSSKNLKDRFSQIMKSQGKKQFLVEVLRQREPYLATL